MSRIPPALPPRSNPKSQTSFIQHSTVSESSSCNIFDYCELEGDEFRLLLLPNATGPRLYTLEHFDLYAAPPYLALSYSWGREDSNAEIIINGDKFKLPTKNLEIALEYLVDRYPGQYLWTDAICNNQKNEDEKFLQIPRMKEIYTRTNKCVVWLGPCPRGSLVDRALPQLPGLLQRLQRYPPYLGFNAASFRRYGIPVPESDEWKGLGDLMMNEWFTRVWTFQESVLPKTLEILCGNHVISTEHLGQLAGILAAMPESGSLKSMSDAESDRTAKIKVGLTRVNTVAISRRQRSDLIPTQYTIFDTIVNSTTWGVTNPCDRIYGVLGLSEDRGLEMHLKPYNIKEPNELFLKFSKYWIHQDKHYQLFHFVPSNHFASEWDGPDKQFRGRSLPSWCPSPLDVCNASSFWYAGLAAKYTAGIEPGRSRGEIRPVRENEDAIQVEGFTVDKILSVDKCPWERQAYAGNPAAREAGARETLDWERRCRQISRSIYHSGNPSPQFLRQHQQENPLMRAAQGIAGLHQPENPALRVAQGLTSMFLNAAARANANRAIGYGNSQDDIPDAHWQTLIANKDGNGKFYTGKGREACRLALMHLNNLAQSHLPSPQFNARQQLQLQDYLQAFGFGARGRAFVSTERGRIGLVPQHTLPGDKVVILWNAGSPYVLRPVGDRNFKLVGEAYIHGLMYGEALAGRQGLRDEWLVLE